MSRFHEFGGSILPARPFVGVDWGDEEFQSKTIFVTCQMQLFCTKCKKRHALCICARDKGAIDVDHTVIE